LYIQLDLSNYIFSVDRVEMPKNVPLSQARVLVDKQLAEAIPDANIRAFILTNLVASPSSR